MLVDSLAFNLLEAARQICSSAEYSSITGENNSFDAIVDIKEGKSVLQLLGHDFGEGIEAARSVQSHNLYRCDRAAIRRMVCDFDFLEVQIRI